LEGYIKNIKLIVFFSISFLLAFLIPLFSPTPTYIALGGIFLRTGSMFIDLTYQDIGLILLSLLSSLFLISFAIVAINLLIKSQRTLTNIRTEIIEGVEKYTLIVFWLYTMAFIISLVVILISYEYNLQELIAPLFSLLVHLPLFYMPAAIVIDEMRPINAMKMSLYMIRKRFKYFVLFILVGWALLSISDLFLISLKSYFQWSSYVVLIINSLFILPFLIILQTQIYLTKYTILK